MNRNHSFGSPARPKMPGLAQTALARLTLIAVLAAQPNNGFAHNNSTHYAMTDFAYETMLAVARFQNGGKVAVPLSLRFATMSKEMAGMALLFGDIAKAVPKLRALPSALPDNSSACADPDSLKKIGTKQPDWSVGNFKSLAEIPMNQVRFPVRVDYIAVTDVKPGETPTDCAINFDWSPDGLFTVSNPGIGTDPFTTRDHTGVVLGAWAQHPDDAIDDWHIFSPHAELIDEVKTLTEVNLALGGSAFVSLACVFACMTAPLACQACVSLTVGLVDTSIHAVSSIPDFSDWKDPMFTGMGHHIDMKPTAQALSPFDDRHGFYADDPGPVHLRDSFELLATAGSDALGLRVKFNPSNGPKRYESIISGSGDFHKNTVHRDMTDWETATWPHTQLTPLDNFALFGWQQFEAMKGAGSFPAPGVLADGNHAAKFLGWPLHAIGDAAVPMHVTNTVGWGHRPYEDAVAFLMFDPSAPLLAGNDPVAQTNIVAMALGRAIPLRKMIIDWRAAHPGVLNEVPIRDFITAIAAGTFAKSMAQSDAIFDPNASLTYMLAKDTATQAYETPARRAIFLDLLIDGIAAEIAFLTSAAEVLP